MLSTLCIVILVFLKCCTCSEETKGSLAFVIDDTSSMSGEIAEVKSKVEQIFRAVLKSKLSYIDNFILVTFNDNEHDPTFVPVKLRANTRDSNTYLKELRNIKVDGGNLCPELSMHGIKFALEESRPNSQIYVFTDASSRDYDMFEDVKNFAQEKSIQVTFLLTGDCGSTESEDYLKYYELAEATNGEVFRILVQDISDIIEYIIHQIEAPRTALTKFGIGQGVTDFNFTVGNGTKDVSVGIHVEKGLAKLNLTDPDGSTPPTTEIVDIKNVKVVKVTEPKLGTYLGTVESEGVGRGKVTMSTPISFQHGFSILKPTSVRHTTPRPIAGVKSYLSIKLESAEGDPSLHIVNILAMDDKVLYSIPVEVINEEEKVYVTDPFVPPEQMFQIEIIAIDSHTGDKHNILGRTPVEPDKPPVDKIENVAPEVVIENSPMISATYNDSLTLTCKVKAYPMPTIIWEDQESGTPLLSSVSKLKIPYDYISFMKIDNVNKNRTYSCKAKTDIHSEAKASIEVKTIRPDYFNLIIAPTDRIIDFKSYDILHCIVDAFPTATITWYKGDRQLTDSWKDIDISSNRTSLIIKNMQLDLEGEYSCKAENSAKIVYYNFTLKTTNVDAPLIDKSSSSVTVKEGSEAIIKCWILKGLPTPQIQWEFKQPYANQFAHLNETDQEIRIDRVDLWQAGSYKCKAHNVIGNDSHLTELFVHYAPHVAMDNKEKIAKQGDLIKLRCQVDSYPLATVRWLFNGRDISRSWKYTIYWDNTLRFVTSLDNSGDYTCEAENDIGSTSETVRVTVHFPVKIAPPKHSPLIKYVGNDISLTCSATGYPKPKLQWQFHGFTSSRILNTTDKILNLTNIQIADAGFYSCIAANNYSDYIITYEVKVIVPIQIETPESTTYNVLEGSGVTRIPCKATGYPPPKINWTFNGSPLALGDGYDMEEDGTLLINDSKKNIEGKYICIADNGISSKYQAFNINISDMTVY